MTPSPEAQPLAVDYSGRPLTEGATVAFLTYDPIGLCEGRIRIIGPNDLCIDTGQHLVTFPAAQKFAGSFRIRPIGGTVEPRPIPDGAQQYPQVALQLDPDRPIPTTPEPDGADAERFKQDYLNACKTIADMHAAATGRRGEAPTRSVIEDVEDVRLRAERAETRLRLAHQARRGKEHQLDDVRRALCDAGFMKDDDPYGHADLADVIRQVGEALREKPTGLREQRERPAHPDGTPYRYHEIVAEGWEFCEGCHTWSTATIERPHTCTGANRVQPRNPEDGA